MRRVHRLVGWGVIVVSGWGASVLAGCLGEDPELSPPPAGTNADAGPPVVQPDSSAPGTDTGDACPAGQQRCDEKCVSTSTDRDHCGACGHDCAGGDCKDGVCQPVLIAPSVHLPLGVTAAGNAVFWTREDSDTSVVESCPKTGCVPPIKEIATSAGRAFTADVPTGATILTNGVYVHWMGKSPEPGVDNNVVYTCSVTGCDGKSPDYVAAPSSVWQIGRTGGTLYFRTDAGLLSFCPFGTCTNANVKRAATGDNGSIGVAVSTDRVFFDDAFDGSVSSCPVGAENCTRAAPYFKTAGKLNFLATAGTKIVAAVTNGGTTSILACEAGGGATCAGQPTPLASNLSPVSAIVGDADSVYFALRGAIGSATGEIRRCKLPDCAGGPKPVVTNLGYPSSLWLDDGVLFWAARGTPPVPSSGSIGKVRP